MSFYITMILTVQTVTVAHIGSEDVALKKHTHLHTLKIFAIFIISLYYIILQRECIFESHRRRPVVCCSCGFIYKTVFIQFFFKRHFIVFAFLSLQYLFFTSALTESLLHIYLFFINTLIFFLNFNTILTMILMLI